MRPLIAALPLILAACATTGEIVSQGKALAFTCKQGPRTVGTCMARTMGDEFLPTQMLDGETPGSYELVTRSSDFPVAVVKLAPAGEGTTGTGHYRSSDRWVRQMVDQCGCAAAK